MSSLPTILSLLSTQEKLLKYKAYDCYSSSQQHLKTLISDVYENEKRKGTVGDFLKNDLPLIKSKVTIISNKIEKEANFLEGYFSRVLNKSAF